MSWLSSSKCCCLGGAIQCDRKILFFRYGVDVVSTWYKPYPLVLCKGRKLNGAGSSPVGGSFSVQISDHYE